VLYDKQIAEAIYTQPLYNQKKAKINRGSKTVVDAAKLKKLKATDRYKATADGVSPRWFPGSKADTYCAQGDEHNPEGLVDETSENAIAQMNKRMQKLTVIQEKLPDPDLYIRGKVRAGVPSLDTLIIGWGSTKGPVLDVLENRKSGSAKKVGYLHYSYMWPLKTDRFVKLAKKAKKVVLVEGNHQGQLGMLLKQESGVSSTHQVLKYDGRPFFYDELVSLLKPYL